jgi:hypothetical protein
MMVKSAKQVMNAVTQLKLPPNKPTKSPATSGPKLELITAICAEPAGKPAPVLEQTKAARHTHRKITAVTVRCTVRFRFSTTISALKAPSSRSMTPGPIRSSRGRPTRRKTTTEGDHRKPGVPGDSCFAPTHHRKGVMHRMTRIREQFPTGSNTPSPLRVRLGCASPTLLNRLPACPSLRGEGRVRGSCFSGAT